jgi:hypothetical protein
MGSVSGRIKTDFLDPGIHKSEHIVGCSNEATHERGLRTACQLAVRTNELFYRAFPGLVVCRPE